MRDTVLHTSPKALDAYEAITSQLGLTPERSVAQRFETAQAESKDASEADADLAFFTVQRIELAVALSVPMEATPRLVVDRETGSRVIIRPDESSGCAHCFDTKIKAFSEIYGREDDYDFTEQDLDVICILFAYYHDLDVATSRFNKDQNWSLFFPQGSCPACGSRERTTHLFRTRYDKFCREVASAETTSANDFVTRNRQFIGFSAIVGNFSAIDEEVGAFLTHGPVVMNRSTVEIAGGKGDSLEQSMASCLGEGLERYFLSGTFRDLSLVGPRRNFGPLAADLCDQFGFPSNDQHTSLATYSDDTAIEWIVVQDLTHKRNKLLPANFIYCPYIAPDGASPVVSSSTNGAAAGKDVASATRQGLLEIIERDAFWFSGRTGGPTYTVINDDIPSDVQDYVKQNDWAEFVFTLLPTPFHGVFVSQVVLESKLPHTALTARGTGATTSLQGSVRRAFNECLQMFHSLTSTIGEPESPLDMRALWSSGQARKVLPNFFSPLEKSYHRDELDPTIDVLDYLIEQCRHQGLTVYNHILMQTSTFAVCKPVVSLLAVTDPTKFDNNNRFDHFDQICGLSHDRIVYNKSLFM